MEYEWAPAQEKSRRSSSTVWVHGHAGRLQAATGFAIERLGYFLRLKADMEAETWVHYAIPVALGATPLLVAGVAVELRTWGQGDIAGVHLWDGSCRLAATEGPLASPFGTQRRKRDTGEALRVVHTGLASGEPVTSALGVSVLIRAQKARDAIALAGVGVTLAQGAGAEPD